MYAHKFHLPADLEPYRDKNFRIMGFPEKGAIYDTFNCVLGQQMGFMTGFSRMALDDVSAQKQPPAPVRLLGGVSPFTDIHNPFLEPYVDFLDQHSHGNLAGEFFLRGNRVFDQASRAGKRACFTEVGLKGCLTRPEEFRFGMAQTLRLAHVFCALFTLGIDNEQELELICFYVFNARKIAKSPLFGWLFK